MTTKQNIDEICNLANYDNMKNYYLMAIELNNPHTMSNLAYYFFIEYYDKIFRAVRI
jgi:hypothetical protein